MRLTKKDFQFRPEDIIQLTNIKTANIYNKLGKLEDLEEELGCPLEVIFKALKEGFYTVSNGKLQLFKECDNRIVFIRHLGYDVEICCEQAKNEIHSKCEMFLERSTKDYKITWWLNESKEE